MSDCFGQYLVDAPVASITAVSLCWQVWSGLDIWTLQFYSILIWKLLQFCQVAQDQMWTLSSPATYSLLDWFSLDW